MKALLLSAAGPISNLSVGELPLPEPGTTRTCLD